MDKTIILGAGITGLAAGIKTGGQIFEAAEVPGGICRSYYIDGYRFENGGGHWIFGENDHKAVLQKFAACNKYERSAGVFYDHIFNYPIQAQKEKPFINDGTIKDWMHKKFGPDLCRMFFDPFNEKYTAGFYNLAIQDDEKKSPKTGLGYNCSYLYPERGLDYLVDEMAKECSVTYNKKAVSVDLAQKIVAFEDGTKEDYDRLISTIPLTKILQMTKIRHEPLPYSSALVLNIGGIPGKRFPKQHWLYVPFCKAGHFRVQFYSNVDSSFAPAGKISLCVELALRPSEDPGQGYVNDVIEELKDIGWIDKVEVIDKSYIHFAYTWLYKNHRRQEYIDQLKRHNIISTGRYGKWKFQGILESFEDGLSL